MNKSSILNKTLSKGFTLIELLIVIAVLGVLAAVVLVAIDPVEQLARGRDAGRKSSVTQLGRAFQAYYTVNGVYPTTAQWTTSVTTNVLVLSGDIKVIPTQSVPIPATVCAGGTIVNNYCYKVDAVPNIVVYTHMESKSARNVNVACGGNGANTWYVYASISGRAGIVCQAGEPNTTTSYTFF